MCTSNFIIFIVCKFSNFFFSDDDSRREFYTNHQDLVKPAFWRDTKEKILAGHQDDILPYPAEQRFSVVYPDTQELIEQINTGR